MKDHMKVNLSQVLKTKNSREDSREKNLSYPHIKTEPYCISWAKLRIPSIPCSPLDIYQGIHQDPNYIATGIGYAANKGDLYTIQDSSIPNIKDQDRCLQDSNLPMAM